MPVIVWQECPALFCIITGAAVCFGPAGLFPGMRSMDSLEGLEEERRLCYVGITRAEEKLYMTGAVARMLYGRTDYTRESQFLKEIDPGLFSGDSDRLGKRSYQEPGGGEVRAAERRPAYGAGNRPFDRVREIKEKNAQRKRTAGGGSFEAGCRVRHDKFGEGLVISISGNNIATVAFDSVGMKKLALGTAPMERIDS